MRAWALTSAALSLTAATALSRIHIGTAHRLNVTAPPPEVVANINIADVPFCPAPRNTQRISAPGRDTIRWTPRGPFAALIRGRAFDEGFGVHGDEISMANDEDGGRRFCSLLTSGDYGISWGAMAVPEDANGDFRRGCKGVQKHSWLQVFYDLISVLEPRRSVSPSSTRMRPEITEGHTPRRRPMRGVYEAVNPKTGETVARDVTLHPPGTWRALTPQLVAALRRNNASTYNGLSDAEIQARIRRGDSFLFTLQSRTSPADMGTLVVTLNEGHAPGVPQPGIMYIGQLTSPSSTPGGGKELLDLALAFGRTRGMRAAVAYTNNIQDNARFYLTNGAALHLEESASGRPKLTLRWPLSADAAALKASCVVSLHGLTPAQQIDLITDHLHLGHTVFGYDPRAKTFNVDVNGPASGPRL